MSTGQISPSEEDLTSVVLSLKTAHPTLGISKILALLLSENPTWTVSEKRLRRILAAAGLVQQPPAQKPKPAAGGHVYPSSALIEGLDIAKWTQAVSVVYFDKQKGKGLVAKAPIAEGQVVWKEDPFVLGPEWDIYDLQAASRACGYCSTPLTDSPLILPCSSTRSSTLCPVRFCNRLCLKRSERTHPLLCAAQNPASAPLLAFARQHAWMALHALTHCAARLLLAAQAGDAVLAEDWRVYSALAELGMEERAQGSWLRGAEPDRETWEAAHKVFVRAFVAPPDAAAQKKLARLVKRPLPKEISDALFSLDGFLHGLGRMGLNLEAHGGLYILHSHMNHSCRPNISVRHLEQRTALSRITLVAQRDIAAGEELFVTYVNPSLSVRERRSQLGAWGFGQCQCERCLEEEKDTGAQEEAALPEMDDLEKELKAGLGVM
ncbi:hypothetical protein BC834DRAFT_957927 [Gloeopeniophorella convolvens]|nr:hypothetical protein BC834DRAFT_957927 [Gloeopeniophorella convolvens]